MAQTREPGRMSPKQRRWFFPGRPKTSSPRIPQLAQHVAHEPHLLEPPRVLAFEFPRSPPITLPAPLPSSVAELDASPPKPRPEEPISLSPGDGSNHDELNVGESQAQSTAECDGEAMSANFAHSPIPQLPHIVVQDYELRDRGDLRQHSNVVHVSVNPHEQAGFASNLAPERNPTLSHKDDLQDTERTPGTAQSGQTRSNIVPPVGQPFQIRTPLSEEFPRSTWRSPLPEVAVVPDNRSVISVTGISDPLRSSTPLTNANEKGMGEAETYVSTKPTCSLNLVCYRSGLAGCKLVQVQVAKASRFKHDAAFQEALANNPKLIVSDVEFFEQVRHAYLHQMCNFWRRFFFLKTLRGLRLLSYVSNSRPTVVELDSFVLQEMLYAYNHPSQIDTENVWIDWVFRLRQPDKRHALEFVEGWNGTRIAIAGMTPLVFSTVVGLTWSIKSGDWQSAFTVAGFILTAGTLMLALLATISGIEASGKAVA